MSLVYRTMLLESWVALVHGMVPPPLHSAVGAGLVRRNAIWGRGSFGTLIQVAFGSICKLKYIVYTQTHKNKIS